MLIYLKREVQGEVLKLFHYALREEGYLLLGTSESVEGAELFREVDKQAHLFGRRNVVEAERHLPKLPFAQPSPLSAALLAPKAPAPRGSYGDLHARMLERYAPPSVLVGADGAIVYLSANAGRYLRDPGGEPTHDLLKRVAPPLRAELRALLYEVSQTSEVARSRLLTLNLGGQLRGLTLRASRAAGPEEGVTLLIFDEHEPVTPVTEAARPDNDRTVRQLEEELERTRGRLQSVVKEYEASREAMQASNEELRSINEELRSTAEELETSKEKLQSINEELITLNQENKHKVEELSRLTSDLQNLFAATDVVTLFLDREGRIKRFTPKVAQLFNILASDLGRPLTHLAHKLGPGAFVDDAQTVLRTLVPIECEVQSDSGTWYLLRLHPYRTADDRIDGVVLTFVEIDQLKRSEAAVRASEETYRAIVSQSVVGIAVAARDERLTFGNRAFCTMLGYGQAELLELRLGDITHPDDLPNNAELLERIWREGRAFRSQTRYRRRDGRVLWVHNSVAPIYEGDRPYAAVAVAIDITQRLEAEADLRALNTP